MSTHNNLDDENKKPEDSLLQTSDLNQFEENITKLFKNLPTAEDYERIIKEAFENANLPDEEAYRRAIRAGIEEANLPDEESYSRAIKRGVEAGFKKHDFRQNIIFALMIVYSVLVLFMGYFIFSYS